MRTQIIAIGNSKGIRIPSSLLKLCRIRSEVDLDVKDNLILIRPIQKQARKGWSESFKLMNQKKEDQLLIPDFIDLDRDDWQW